MQWARDWEASREKKKADKTFEWKMPVQSAAEANQHLKERTNLGLKYEVSLEDMEGKSFVQAWLKLDTEKGLWQQFKRLLGADKTLSQHESLQLIGMI